MQPYLPYDLTLTERLLIIAGPLWRLFARRFKEAFSAGDPPPPHPSAMLDEPNGAYRLIFPRFFKRISVDEEGVERLRQVASRATVVYVTRYVGQLEYNYFSHLFSERGLPRTAYCNALTVRRWMKAGDWWRSIAGQEREIGTHGRPLDPLVDGMLAEMVARGETVMLRVPQADLEEEHISYSNPLRGLRAIIDAQKRGDKPLVIVPVDFIWSRRPPSESRSMVDILFGEKEEPGRIRKFVLFWRNYKRRAQAMLGAPIEVKGLIESNPGASSEELTARLRQILKSTLRLQRRTITGPTIRPRSAMIQEVLSDEGLDELICRIAAERGKSADDLRELAHRYAKEIVSDLDYTYVETLERILGRALTRLFESFNVDTEGLARAKELLGQGPIIFVPNHKSHVDYLVLSYILYHHGMNVPHIAAGKNLSFWPLGQIFRRSGAFFIRRSFKGNELYEAVLETYLKVLVREGHSQEFFIEGGRSRTGKLRNPRTGMLKMLQRAARSSGTANMYYLPVAITYDRVIEQKSYTKELEGGQKTAEGPSHLLGLTKFMKGQKSRYGSIYIRFGTPVPSCGVGEAPEDLDRLAQRICREINRRIVVTPAAVAAAALLAVPDRGVTYPELRLNAKALLACLEAKGVEIPGKLAESPLAVLKDAVTRLEQLKLVVSHDESLEPFVSVDESKRIPLSYYRNGMSHFLVSTAVICRLIRRQQAREKKPTVYDIASALEGSKKLLFREYRFATNRSLAEHAASVLDFLASAGAIAVSTSGEISLTDKGPAIMRVFEAQVMPTLERMLIASRVVLERVRHALEERQLIDEMLQCGGDMYMLGRIRFRESSTRDGFANAINTLVDFGLLGVERQKAGTRQKKVYNPTGDAKAAAALKVELEKLL